MNTEIYLDANATSPVLPAAMQAAQAAMGDCYGNPSSTHATGLKARATLDAVRQRARRLLGVGEGCLVFTSGATEGIQTAVLSVLCAVRERQARGEAAGSLLLYGATEHKAVPESLAHWNALMGTNLELRVLPVDGAGRHRLDVLRELAPQAAMVCTMAANNETGVVSDLDGIAAVLADAAPAAFWMVDSVQALGKMAIDLAATRIDYAPFSGHKLYAPKGIGMLYVRAGAPYTSLMAGGGQEGGQRAGTENMGGVAALGEVLAALEDGHSFRSHAELESYRSRLAEALRLALPGVVFNAPFEGSLPTTLNFSVPGFASRELLDLFDAAGVRVSAGSACSSAKTAPSYVLEAMQLPAWRCAAAVRMSFGPMADSAFIDAACERIARCGAALRASCLIPSDLPAQSRDGVVQLVADGACTWLVLDAASRSCAVIDPRAPLVARIADFVRCQDYRVLAICATSGDAAPGAALAEALGVHCAAGAPLWPVPDGGSLQLGRRSLARAGGAASAASAAFVYLLAQDGAVRFAFVGDGAVDPALVAPTTILCPGHDAGNLALSTPAAESREPVAAGSERWIDSSALEQFLDHHPDALLVDVREAFEHAAAGEGWRGRTADSVPLSRLANRLPDWLGGAQRPLVFFCRSGGRSARAAHCLHRLGYANAWHVSGGL